jgi:hypothetical protein
MFSDEGLYVYLDSALQLARKHPTVPTSEYLPHPTTVYRGLVKMADCVREKLREQIKEVLVGPRIPSAFTTDIYTQPYT